MFGNTDKPIETIANDTFGIRNYVEGLCSFILNCDTPMTISIQGDWGSGKTSIMNMIKEKISKEVCTIWFNTWQFSQFKMQEELSTSLLYSLLAELDYDKENVKKLFGFLSGAAKLATGIITEKVAGGYLAGEITDAMSGNSYDFAAEIKNLKSKFQDAINKKLQIENKERVVIFIDDLDRLQPDKAVELLEVLKAFLDCEKCVYILAVDYEVVTQGIKKKFGDAVGEQKGRSFFDKIIQLPFKMPVAQYNISRYVSSMLVKMSINTDTDVVEKYVSLINLSVGCNPRSMKRLFNTYLLLDIILKGRLSKTQRENSNVLLFAIICMQTEFDSLYKYIVQNRDVIDAETLLSIGSGIDDNDDLAAEFGTDDTDELSRISNFMLMFNKLLADESGSITDESLDNLKDLLSFSTVTSFNVNESIETKTDYDWKYRYINRDIARNVNNMLQSEYGYNFRIWQAKKNTRSHRISDVWSIIDLKSNNGFNYIFDYTLKTDYSLGMTIFGMSVYHDKSTTDGDFNNMFRSNPLSFRCVRNENDLQYEKIIRFLDSETDNISTKIVPIIKNALDELAAFTSKEVI